MPTTISVSFHVRGKSFDPHVFSEEVGLSATKIWIKGQSVGEKSVVKGKENEWIISIGELSTRSVENQLRKILSRLRPYTALIIKNSKIKKLQADFAVAVYLVGDNTPSINLSSKIINEIAKYNAVLDIDIICIDE